MKKLMFLAAVMCVFSMAAFAQKATNYAGTWTLDVSKSKLDERMRIESMTLTVEQTAAELTVTSATKRAAPPADAQRPAGGGGGGMGGARMGGMGGGDGKTVYALDGKETKTEIEGRMGKVPVTLKAKAEGTKLTLTRSSTFTGPNGEMTNTTKETWELGADGKTLTVNREQTSPMGPTTSTLVFTKS